MIEYIHMKTNLSSTLTTYVDGHLKTVTDQNPNFEDILGILESQDQGVTLDDDDIEHLVDLLDEKLTTGVSRALRTLVDGVEFDEDTEELFFEGSPVHGTIKEHIAARLADGSSDWEPLAKFLSRLQKNPSYHSREQLYDWLTSSGVTITTEGYIIAYKGLTRDGFSHHSGGAFVDGVWVDGQVPNEIGSIIALDRTKINDDPTEPCSYGLHAGSWEYAQGYHSGRIATVLIDPADFVSVPKDAAGEKCRISRYTVQSVMIGDRAQTQRDHINLERNTVVDPSKLNSRFTDVFDEDD